MPRSTCPLAFEMVVLGQSGGPTETELSGYILKPYETAWTDGWVGLEGGAGIGALSSLLYQAAINTALRERCGPSSSSSTSTSTSATTFTSKYALTTSDPNPSSPPLQRLPNTPGPTPTNSASSETFPTISNVESGMPGEVTLRSLGISTGSEEDDMPMVEELTMFPGLVWPEECSSPLLKAAWFFSLLSSQLITHAHFDHILALVLATGSLPPRNLAPYPPGSKQHDPPVRIPVYAQRNVLEKIATVYDGEIWPELGAWASRTVPPSSMDASKRALEEQLDNVTDAVAGMMSSVVDSATTWVGRVDEGHGQSRRSSHDRQMEEMSTWLNEAPPKDAYPLLEGVGILYCPMPDQPQYQRLPISGTSQQDPTKRIGLSCLHMPVLHGKTSRGDYESTAFFINVDEAPAATRRVDELEVRMKGPEILFWGDVESHLDDERAGLEPVDDVNIRVWREAATRWDEGRLGAVFIECSYSSDRPYHLMFGHLRPQSLYAELERLADCVQPPSTTGTSPTSTHPTTEEPPTILPLPLEGLKIYIIHVKQPLKPCSSGMGIMTLIKKELDDLEREARAKGKGLGVDFVMLRKGMRIVV